MSDLAPAPASAPVSAPSAPRAVADLAPPRGLRVELRLLRNNRLFWVGLALKIGCAALFGSHFATRWFAPFLYTFVHGKFAHPYAAFLAQGEPMAFPYGPGMLITMAIAWIPALFVSFDPASHFGLFLL